ANWCRLRVAHGAVSSLFLSVRTILALLCVAFFGSTLRGENLNALILEQVRKMPRGGRYSTSHFATIKLQSLAHFESGKFLVIPTAPYPSFCSGATYLVFVKALEALRERGELQLDFATLNQLVIRDQDRKSTRLNSSHSQISYAVFC